MAASRWAAVLGQPIAHSLSPVLHRAAYAALGLPWTYDAREVDVASLPAALAAARSDPAFAGYSLTMPLKAAAVPLLDSVSGSLPVINTVVPSASGLVGHNTDVLGILAAIEELGTPAGPALVLGGGGTARAAVAAVRGLGREVTAAVRRATAVEGWPVEVSAFDAVDVAAYGLVIATTPAGATDELAARGWPASTALVDVLYSPWPTPLAAAALAAGAPVAGGLTVLLGQAVAQVALMTGMEAPVEAMRAALDAATAVRRSSGDSPDV